MKSKLAEEIDSLDPDDRHYIKRKAGFDDRLYRMYEKIEVVETQLIEARELSALAASVMAIG